MSLARKLSLAVTFVAATILTISGYLLWRVELSQSVKRAMLQARTTAALLQVAAAKLAYHHGHLGQLVDEVSRDVRFSASFFDRQGRQIAPAPPEAHPAADARVRRVMQRNRGTEALLYESARPADVVVTLPLSANSRVVGAVQLRMDLRSSGASSRPLMVLTIIGASLLLLALCVQLIARQLLHRPLSRLNLEMSRVGQGQLDAVLPLDRIDQIGAIAYRFNEMTAQLRASQDRIRATGEANLALEQRLRQSEKLAAIGQLAAEVAHEIGTPLNVIAARAQLLRDCEDLPPKLRRHATIVGEQSQRITAMIQRLLLWARPAAISQYQTVDPQSAIDEALCLLEPQLRRKGLKVDKAAIADDLPSVYANPNDLQQVLNNLLSNAVEATPDGGEIRLKACVLAERRPGMEAAAKEQCLMLQVADDGPGIPADAQDQVFDAFFSTKRAQGGTGLGLSIVQGIVSAQGGWLSLDSQAGRGATFSVYLPLDRAAVAAPATDLANTVTATGDLYDE